MGKNGLPLTKAVPASSNMTRDPPASTSEMAASRKHRGSRRCFTAATLPAQIVMADRYVNGGGDLSQIAAQPWDPSVQGLAHYPTVLKWLDDNLPWTTEVGQAFLNQQQEVMASIQRLRL